MCDGRRRDLCDAPPQSRDSSFGGGDLCESLNELDDSSFGETGELAPTVEVATAGGCDEREYLVTRNVLINATRMAFYLI